MIKTALIQPRPEYLTSIHHRRHGSCRGRPISLRVRGLKDNILFNGLGLGRHEPGCRFAHRLRSFALIRRTIVRAVMTSVVLAAGALLAGCNSDDVSLASNAKANQPVPPKLVAAITEKDMELQSPILIRLFKQEA